VRDYIRALPPPPPPPPQTPPPPQNQAPLKAVHNAHVLSEDIAETAERA
jgi:hypothetical protein